jgi:hypothetical protein
MRRPRTVFGTAPNIIYEDDKDLLRCYNPAVGEYYLSTDNYWTYRRFYPSICNDGRSDRRFLWYRELFKRSSSLWNEKGSQLEVERMIAHAIEPNFSVNGFGKLSGNFTWRETYWIYGANSSKPLRQKGFVDQPFTAARWSTQSNDAYGRSVGMDVLPDVMQLQVMTSRMAEAIEKQVRPPLVGSMELKNKPTSTLPGHLTFVSDGSRTVVSVRSMKSSQTSVRWLQNILRSNRGFRRDCLTISS